MEQLRGVNPVKLEGKSAHRIQCVHEDPANNNSGVLSYFQSGISHNDLRAELVNELLMQVLTQPFFNELRTDQQLGYAVFAQCCNYRSVMGYRFVIQSDKYCPEYIINQINEFIVKKRQYLKEISDADFEQARASVMTRISVKDINLYAMAGRYYGEIVAHTYNFESQN